MTWSKWTRRAALGACFLLVAAAAHGQAVVEPSSIFGGPGDPLTKYYATAPTNPLADQVFFPSTADLLLQQAYSDYQQDRDDQAAPELEGYLKQAPQSVPAHLLLAEVYLRQNKAPQAIPQLEAVTYLHPEDPQTQYRLGEAYLQVGQYDKAVRLYQVAHARNPRDARPAFELGVALSREGRPALAGDAFAQAAALNRKDSRAALLAGLSYHQAGDDAQAVPALQNALALGSPQKYAIHTALAEAATAAGDYNEAVRRYTLALKVVPDDFSATANTGVALQNLGRNAEARAFYQKALTLKGGDEASRAEVAAHLKSLSQP